MKKFKMPLVWHNCETCPPEEDHNPWLIYTDGDNIYTCEYWKETGFPIAKKILHDFWWADLANTVREFKKPDLSAPTTVHLSPVCSCGYEIKDLKVNQSVDEDGRKYSFPFYPTRCPKCGRWIESMDVKDEYLEAFVNP